MKTLEPVELSGTLKNKTKSSSTNWLKIGLCSLVIAISLLAFFYNGIYRSLDSYTSLENFPSADFERFYAAGQLWNEGADPYNYKAFVARFGAVAGEKQVSLSPSGYFYPPQTTALLALLPRLSLQDAYLVTLVIDLILLVVALWLLAYIISWFRPVGLIEITLLIALTNTGFARTNIRAGQTGLIVCVPLLIAFILGVYGRKWLAGLGFSLLSIKPTFLPLYMGYYLLRRVNSLVITCVVVSGLLTLLPLILTQRAVVDSLLGWVQSMQSQANPGNADDPNPFVPGSATMLHLTPLVYRVFNGQSTLTSAIGGLIILGVVGYAAFLIWRSRASYSRQVALLDFGLVSALSLLAIYHRNYDIFLIFPGLLYIFLHTMTVSQRKAQLGWGLFVAVSVVLLCLPQDLPLQLYYKVSFLQDNYLWRVVSPFQTWVAVATLGVLFWLKVRQLKAGSNELEHQVTPPIPEREMLSAV